jgi:Holliday junction resolvase-like predicted endonuclease
VLQRLLRLLRRKTPLGARGEETVAAHLRSLGWRILDRNVRVPMGEADIIAEAEGGEIVLVEVKCRLLGPHKAAKLRAIMKHLCRANDWEQRRKRIDVVAVDWPKDGTKPVVRHFRNAVGG